MALAPAHLVFISVALFFSNMALAPAPVCFSTLTFSIVLMCLKLNGK